MRWRIATIVAGLAMLAMPVAADAQITTIRADANDADRPQNAELAAYEQRYLEVRKEYVDEFGLREAGRNIVRDGYREREGEVRPATKAEVVRSTERMESALNPPEPPAEPTATATTTETSSGVAAASSTVACESGGDYGAVNPAGYYGAYQFDQQTWNAYAPEGYEGTNPAAAPPAVQDAAAANVPYDAWPHC